MQSEFSSFPLSSFSVEEIAPWGSVLEIDSSPVVPSSPGTFSWFVLQKKDWNTMQALREVARALHIKYSRLNFAGTKDRNAVTTQLCSAFAVAPERLLSLRIKDLKILCASSNSEKVRLGQLLGNRFTLSFSSSVPLPNSRESLFPNLFGSQRFGSIRENTAEVGLHLLRGDFEGAVMNYLCFPGSEEVPEAREARARLLKEQEFSSALTYFPKHLKYERQMLFHLSSHPKEFVSAFRCLPRQLELLFVHAVQSKLFNDIVSSRLDSGTLFVPLEGDSFCPPNSYGFPDVDSRASSFSENSFILGNLLGYDSVPSAEEKEFLEKNGLSLENFKIRSIPEISSRGTIRPLYAPIKNLSISDENKKLSFELPSGSYATVCLLFLAGKL